MRSKYLPRILAVCAALVLVAAACGGDDDGDTTSTTLATEAPTEEPAPVADDPELVIGQVMPETGALAFLRNAPSDRCKSVESRCRFGKTFQLCRLRGNVRKLLTGDCKPVESRWFSLISRCGVNGAWC